MSSNVRSTCPTVSIVRLALLLAVLLAIATLGCKKNGGGSGCAALAATAFGCADPNDCVAVITTWNYPGAPSTASADLDLRLEINGATTEFISYISTPRVGCRHTGDAQASSSNDESAEGVICDPPQMAGDYTFSWFTFFPLSVRVDVNDHGAVSCSIRDGADSITLAHP